MSRCTGHCCRRFSLSQPPEVWEAIRAAADLVDDGGDWPEDVPLLEDGTQIARMVEHLGRFPMGGIKTIIPPERDPTEPMDVYRCTLLVGDNCSVYETRPGMCRRYPDTTEGPRACGRLGCTSPKRLDPDSPPPDWSW